MVLQYFTIRDSIIKHSIDAIVNSYVNERNNNPVLVGGIAVQLHSQNSELLRPTRDIDIIYALQIIDYKHFSNGIGGTIKDYLLKKEYQVQLKKIKKRDNYEVKIMNGQGNKARELFFINFDYISTLPYEAHKSMLEKEISNAIELNYSDNALSRVLVIRLEDIIIHKIKRVKKIFEKIKNNVNLDNKFFVVELSLLKYAENSEWANLANMPLKNWLDNIIVMQNNLNPENNPTSKRNSLEMLFYTLNKDIYDICLLSQKIEGKEGSFNKAYYLKSKDELYKLCNLH